MDPRVLAVVQEVVRLFPCGAPTIAVLDALRRLGLSTAVALVLMEELRRGDVLRVSAGRWQLPDRVDAAK